MAGWAGRPGGCCLEGGTLCGNVGGSRDSPGTRRGRRWPASLSLRPASRQETRCRTATDTQFRPELPSLILRAAPAWRPGPARDTVCASLREASCACVPLPTEWVVVRQLGGLGVHGRPSSDPSRSLGRSADASVRPCLCRLWLPGPLARPSRAPVFSRRWRC